MASDDLRARIAEALMAWAETNNAPQYASMRRPATVVANANSRADAVLAVVQPELDRLQAACRSAAVLLRSVADEGSGVGTLLDAARALDDIAGPERPWLTNPPVPCSPVPCDDCPICKTDTEETAK